VYTPAPKENLESQDAEESEAESDDYSSDSEYSDVSGSAFTGSDVTAMKAMKKGREGDAKFDVDAEDSDLDAEEEDVNGTKTLSDEETETRRDKTGCQVVQAA